MIRVGRVTAYNPPSGVVVSLKTSGQGPSVSVRMGRDYSDALRVRMRPLPTIGTWGLIFFPDGDIRSGVWGMAIEPGLLDALHYTGAVTDPYNDYDSHYSGYWFLRDGLGNFAEQHPDGSYFIAASGTALPTIYRHIVDSNQIQQKVAFTRSDRIPHPPSPYYYLFHHQTGTQISCDVSGNVSVSGNATATLSIAFNWGTLAINSSGVSINLPGSNTLNIDQAGGALNDAIVLVSKFLSKFNAHVHSDPQGGNTGVPTVALVATDVESTAVKISN